MRDAIPGRLRANAVSGLGQFAALAESVPISQNSAVGQRRRHRAAASAPHILLLGVLLSLLMYIIMYMFLYMFMYSFKKVG